MLCKGRLGLSLESNFIWNLGDGVERVYMEYRYGIRK